MLNIQDLSLILLSVEVKNLLLEQDVCSLMLTSSVPFLRADSIYLVVMLASGQYQNAQRVAYFTACLTCLDC